MARTVSFTCHVPSQHLLKNTLKHSETVSLSRGVSVSSSGICLSSVVLRTVRDLKLVSSDLEPCLCDINISRFDRRLWGLYPATATATATVRPIPSPGVNKRQSNLGIFISHTHGLQLSRDGRGFTDHPVDV